MNKIKTLTEIQNETGLSKTIIKSLLVDYNIPSVQLGDNRDSLILVDEEQFKKVFKNVNVELKLRTQEKRRKSREYSRKWYSENSDSEIEKATERADKNTNTFGRRTGHARGQGSMVKRDYELTKEELKRQKRCAVIGLVGALSPSEHFLFDFDLEQMLKDNVYVTTGGKNKYITKWWDGEINDLRKYMAECIKKLNKVARINLRNAILRRLYFLEWRYEE